MADAHNLKEEEIRCFCRRKPLLAVAGVDSDGQGYIHVKSWKQGRLYVELVVTEGTVHICCRECLRWQRIRIVRETVTSSQEGLPETITL